MSNVEGLDIITSSLHSFGKIAGTSIDFPELKLTAIVSSKDLFHHMPLAITGTGQMRFEAAGQLVGDHLLHRVLILLIIISGVCWLLLMLIAELVRIIGVENVFWRWPFSMLKVVVDVVGLGVLMVVVVDDVEGVGGHQVKLGLGLKVVGVDAEVQLDQALLLVACGDWLPRRTINRVGVIII